MKPHTPSFGFGGEIRQTRTMSKYEKRPEPGTYTLGHKSKKGITIGGRPTSVDYFQKQRAQMPAPNAYNDSKFLSKSSCPSTKFGSSPRQPDIHPGKRNLPGPGTFDA